MAASIRIDCGSVQGGVDLDALKHIKFAMIGYKARPA